MGPAHFFLGWKAQAPTPEGISGSISSSPEGNDRGKMKSNPRAHWTRCSTLLKSEVPVLNGRSTPRRLLTALVFLGVTSFAAAQSPDCGVLLGVLKTQLPNFSGTLPPSADMTTAGNANYLYVLTQWGFARGSLANPANP